MKNEEKTLRRSGGGCGGGPSGTVAENESGDAADCSPAPRDTAAAAVRPPPEPSGRPSRERRYPVECLLFTAAASAALLIRHGFCSASLRLILLAAVLSSASAFDLRERRVPDSHSVMIMIASLAGRTAPSEIVAGAASGAAVFLALAAVRGLCRPGSLGGADIKLSAASACVLGIFRCCAAVAAGVSIALAVSAVQNRASARVGSFRDTAFPFVPYLAAGCMLSALF